MTDRTVKVRLEADISDFVTDIGVKAVAVVNRLEASAEKANVSLRHIGNDTSSLDKLGTKADTTGQKLERAGVRAVAAGRMMGDSAGSASKNVEQLTKSVQKVDKATSDNAATARIATKDIDAHANAVGRLRVAQLRLAEIQSKSNASASSLAGAEESVKSAERAVKKFEEAGDKSGKGFVSKLGSALKKWVVGDGASVFKQLGENVGGGFFASLRGVLATPVIGPIVAGLLLAAVVDVAVPTGAVLAGGVVAGFGAGIGALGLKFAAESNTVKAIWTKTAADLGAETRSISKPFESTLAAMALVARRTFATFKPELAAAFKGLGPALTGFGDQLGQALGKLAPAIQPLAGAFSKILSTLGPALNDVFENLSRSLIKLSESVSKNPTALADFARGIGSLTGMLLGFITDLNNVDAAFKRLTGISSVTALFGQLQLAAGLVIGPLDLLAKGFGKVADGIDFALSRQFPEWNRQSQQAATSSASFSDSLFKTAASLTAQTNSALHAAHANHQANVDAYLAATAFDRQSAATNKLVDSLNRLSSRLLSQKDAQLGYAQSVADATAAIKENGRTHADNTQKGRDNQRALLANAQAANTQRDAMLKSQGATVATAAATEKAKATFVRLAQQMGYSAAEARKLANDYIKIPNVDRKVRITTNITDLESKLKTAKKQLADGSLTKERRAQITANISNLQTQLAKAKAALADPHLTATKKAQLKAEITDLQAKIAKAKAALAAPQLSATKRAKLVAYIKQLEDGIAKAKRALASVPASKSVTITTTYTEVHRVVGAGSKSSSGGVGGGHEVTGKGQADGGYYPQGVPSYADGKLPSQAMIAPGKGGGMVQWAEQETGGEAFIPLAPSKRDRSEKILGQVADRFGMGLVKSFANGGINLANGQLVDITYLLQKLGLPFDPTAGANYRTTLTNANRANRAVAPARNNAIAADRAEQSAKAAVAAIQRQITLQQRAVAAARAPKQTTKAGQKAEDRRVAVEQQKLIKLQDGLYAAKNRVTKATKASNAADAVYKIRAEQAAKASEVNRAALDKLVQQQQAAVDLAKQVSDSLTGSANIGDLFQQSLTGKGLLADLQSEGADLKQFGQLIAQLRTRKLNADLINQIISKGADQGGELAQAILDGGQALVNSLNTAQANLQNQANAIGAGVANAQYNTKVAGHRAGGGGVQAGKTYWVGENGPELLRMGAQPGWVTPNRAVDRGYVRSAGGGGGGATTIVREVHHHHHNTYNGIDMNAAGLIAEKSAAIAEFRSRSY